MPKPRENKIDPSNIVGSAWLSYMDDIIPKDAGNTQITECKRAFVAGAFVVLEAMKRIGEDDISEEGGIEILSDMNREIKRLVNELSGVPHG